MQFIRCHDAKGDFSDFPYQTIANKSYMESFYVKRCLDHLNDNDYMKYCHFMCDDYRFEKFTEIIDGSTILLKKYYFRIISFLRKKNIQVPPLSDFKKMEEVIAEHEAKP